jgi:MscS family membrane protein
MFGFLEAAIQGDYRRATSFMNLPNSRRRAEGPELAEQFKAILDRHMNINPGTLSNNPEGALTDGLDANLESLGTIRTGSRPVELLLERVQQNEGGPIWLISSGTVNLIPGLYERLDYKWIETRLPDWMLVRGPLDTAVWQWLGLLVIAAFAAIVAEIVTRVFVRFTRPLVTRTNTSLDDVLISSLLNPFRLLIGLIAYRMGLIWLTPSVLLRGYLGKILAALFYFALAWIAVRLINIVAARLVIRMTGKARDSASSVVPLVRRTAQAAAVVIAFLATLASWGYDTTAILAGLGVGGIAIALAAQKTIENLFGGVSVTMDKPVLVGDFCRYGDKIGTVEDIGLRSTRVRTLDRTVVTIPNGQFSALEIENFAVRDKIWFHPILQLRLDTTPDQVRTLIHTMRQVLLAHSKVDPNPARVRFVGITDWSLNVEIFAYVLTANFDEFLVVQEELLLSLLDTIKQAGTALAIPAQVNLVARDPMKALNREGRRVLSQDNE